MHACWAPVRVLSPLPASSVERCIRLGASCPALRVELSAKVANHAQALFKYLIIQHGQGHVRRRSERMDAARRRLPSSALTRLQGLGRALRFTSAMEHVRSGGCSVFGRRCWRGVIRLEVPACAATTAALPAAPAPPAAHVPGCQLLAASALRTRGGRTRASCLQQSSTRVQVRRLQCAGAALCVCQKVWRIRSGCVPTNE